MRFNVLIAACLAFAIAPAAAWSVPGFSLRTLSGARALMQPPLPLAAAKIVDVAAAEPAPRHQGPAAPTIVDARPTATPTLFGPPPIHPQTYVRGEIAQPYVSIPGESDWSSWNYQPVQVRSAAPTPAPYSLPYTFLYDRLAQNEGAAADAAAEEATDLESRREPIGEAPPEDVNQQFIRSSILLAPGEVQMEIGLTYAWQESLGIVILPPANLALERIRSRRLLVPFSLRYGYDEKLEIFGVLPLGLAQFERDTPITESTERSGVLGDITVGGIYQLLKANKDRPDVTATFSVTAPTASSPFPSPNGNVASLGNGFWALGGGVTAVKSFDPVVFYGGAGVLYQIDREFFGVNVAPGVQFNYNLGIGFAVNEDITFTTQFSWATQLATQLNGIPVRDSDNEPMSLRLSVIKRTSLKTRVQPFVAFGLNDDATDVQFGIFYTRDIKSCHDCSKK